MSGQSGQGGDEEEEEGGGGGDEDDAEMMMHTQYVLGMLNNLGPQPLSRVENMLRMYMGYEGSEAQLNRFLNRMVEDGQLELSGGQFKIKK